MFIFDAHVHIGEDPLWNMVQFHPPNYQAADLIRSMDANGISNALIYPPVTPSAISIEEQRKANEFVAKEVKKYPDRLLAFAIISPRTGGGRVAANEFEKCIVDFGMKGVKLWPWADFQANAEYVYPLAEICQKYNVPLAIHTDTLDPRCNSLVTADMASQFPKVTVIHAHMIDPFGSFQMVHVAKKYKNLYFETSALPSPSYIEDLVKAVGPERVLWGTDWPYFQPSFKIDLAKVEVLDISEEAKRKILGLNAAKMFSMKPKEVRAA